MLIPLMQEPPRFDCIQAIRISFEETEDSCIVHAAVTGIAGKANPVTQSVSLGSAPGAGANRAYVLDHGKLGIYNRHELSRFNVLVGIVVRDHNLVVDDQYSETVYKTLPVALQKKSNSDNVSLDSVKGDVVKLNFRTRDERDGVKATFRVHNLRWKCLEAKYWRDKSWNGVRQF